MEQPFYSVIIPIYNVEPYLRQCVDSVLMQNFTDYEIILVDDGSTDGSGKICDEYFQGDLRCKVIHQQNAGLAEARNSGITEARGQYLWFLDSDDYIIDTLALDKVVELINSTKADVVVFSYKKYYETTGKYSNSIITGVAKDATKAELIKTNAYKSLAWNKVVNRSFVESHGLSFPKGRRVGEDIPWCADLLFLSKRIMLLADDLVAYRQRLGSLTDPKNTAYAEGRINDALLSMEETVSKYGVDASSNDLLGSYLAYEYSCFLGICFPFYRKYRTRIKSLSFLLNFTLNRKVAKVVKLTRCFGLHGTSYILWLFIKFRNLREEKRREEKRREERFYI